MVHKHFLYHSAVNPAPPPQKKTKKVCVMQQWAKTKLFSTLVFGQSLYPCKQMMKSPEKTSCMQLNLLRHATLKATI